MLENVRAEGERENANYFDVIGVSLRLCVLCVCVYGKIDSGVNARCSGLHSSPCSKASGVLYLQEGKHGVATHNRRHKKHAKHAKHLTPGCIRGTMGCAAYAATCGASARVGVGVGDASR